MKPYYDLLYNNDLESTNETKTTLGIWEFSGKRWPQRTRNRHHHTLLRLRMLKAMREIKRKTMGSPCPRML